MLFPASLLLGPLLGFYCQFDVLRVPPLDSVISALTYKFCLTHWLSGADHAQTELGRFEPPGLLGVRAAFL
jgi:hypothetical protein